MPPVQKLQIWYFSVIEPEKVTAVIAIFEQAAEEGELGR